MTEPLKPGPLPEPEGVIVVNTQALRAFTADQMHAYAAQEVAAAVAVERERCAKLCDNLPLEDPDGPWFNHDMTAGAYQCAAAIRAKDTP